MLPLSELEARYDGPIPAEALAEAIHGPFAYELTRAAGTRAELLALARAVKRRLRRLDPDRPDHAMRRIEGLTELRMYAQGAVRWDKRHRALLAMRRRTRGHLGKLSEV